MKLARLLLILVVLVAGVAASTGCTYTRRDPRTGEEQQISRREYEALRQDDAPAYSGSAPAMRPAAEY